MARILASAAGAGAAPSTALGSSSWLLGLCMVVVSVWVVSFAVFICGRSSHDDDDKPKKKPAPARAKVRPASASRGTARSSGTTATDFPPMYTASYIAAACGGGHHGGGCGGGHHGGGCGGDGGCGGGGGGCGGGGC